MELTLIDFRRLWQLSTNFWPFFGPFDEVASQVLDLGDVPTQLHDGPRFLCVLFVKFVHSLGTYVLFTNDATLKVTRCCCLQKSRKTLNLAKETFFSGSSTHFLFTSKNCSFLLLPHRSYWNGEHHDAIHSYHFDGLAILSRGLID